MAMHHNRQALLSKGIKSLFLGFLINCCFACSYIRLKSFNRDTSATENMIVKGLSLFYNFPMPSTMMRPVSLLFHSGDDLIFLEEEDNYEEVIGDNFLVIG